MYLLEQDYKSWNENVTYFFWNYEHVPVIFLRKKKTKQNKPTQNKQQNSNNNKTTWK